MASAGTSRIFSKLDTDGSGGLSQSEFESMIQNGPQHAGCGGSSNISSTSGTSSTSDTSRLDELFSKLDSDGDGSISQTELEAGKPKDDASNNGLSQMGLSTSDFQQKMQTIFGSLSQKMQDYGNQQYQWFSQDASGGSSVSSSSSQTIS